MPKVWDNFEWDDDDQKNGNIQHLREHRIEPEEAEECFFHDYGFCRTSDLMTSTFWMAVLIEGGFYESSSRIKATGSHAFLQVGT